MRVEMPNNETEWKPMLGAKPIAREKISMPRKTKVRAP